MRAILLAAGMGTRLRPMTLDTPKSLVEVNGRPMLETQIEFLREKGINEIIIVTGYLKEKFEYLKAKYGVTLVHNEKYNIYNNIYTMSLVKDYLPDSYVIDESIDKSTYFSGYKEGFKGEWILEFDADNKVYGIRVGDNEGYILCGVSYWNEQDGNIIVEKLEEAINNGDFENLYWDDIVKDNIERLDVRIRKINSDDCFEIDSLEDLNKVNEYILSKVSKEKEA